MPSTGSACGSSATSTDDLMLRLFVAFDVPEAQKDSVETAVRTLDVPGARWTGRQSWHVTLKFLGPTAEDRLSEVTDPARQSTPPAP